MSEGMAAGQRLQRGDAKAFAELYDVHAPMVYGLARRITGNDAHAEDVTQSVFLTLWSKPQAFKGGNFTAWLATVTRNAALDVVRSAAVRTRADEVPPELPADSLIDDELFSRLRASAVLRAVACLPDEQRVPIEHAYFGGLSYREVAERLGAPAGTVKSRIRAGLRSLWQALREVVPA
jgi:RNA polymerase sigma-70 factor (ECF subfamily)